MGAGIAGGFLAYGTDTVILGRTQAKAEACFDAITACANSINEEWSKLGGQLLAVSISEWNNWTNTNLVIETVSERLELKKAIFADLDQRVPPHVPIGSNSSGFPISDIAGDLTTANRMLNTHYFMPAHIVPLVEIVLGEKSNPEIAEQVAICSTLVASLLLLHF